MLNNGSMDKHSDYCERNCGVDEEIFKNVGLCILKTKQKRWNK